MDLGADGRQPVAHHRRHRAQLRQACCRTSTRTWRWPRTPGPARWNDPDMLEVGNGMRATEDQSRVQPVGRDGRAADRRHATCAAPVRRRCRILTNKDVIAVDQDPLGKQGTEVSSAGGLDVLAKPLANGDVSVALFNETGSTATISTTAAAVGKTGASSYTLTDLWPGAPPRQRGDRRHGARARHRHVPGLRRQQRHHAPPARSTRSGRRQVPGRANDEHHAGHPARDLELQRRRPTRSGPVPPPVS